MMHMLEELSLNALPSIQRLHRDGWILGVAGGYTRRANSVTPLAAGREPAVEKIAWCEDQYRIHGLPTIFKMCPASQPKDLDALLDTGGYEWASGADVLTMALTTAGSMDGVTILTRDAWLHACAAMTGEAPEAHAHHRAIMQGIFLPTCPVALFQRDTPVALGLGVLERGIVGIYNLITHPEHRRRGHALCIMNAITAWATRQGAHRAYLQVEPDNVPAQSLYAMMGFTRAYSYWYRVKNASE